MISLDQVLLLQEKVESAVERIQQLTAENDALRSNCAELTKALTAKTELVSTLESTQNKIETGILTALDRLNAVENSILDGQGHTVQNQSEPLISKNTENTKTDTSYTAETAAENPARSDSADKEKTENTAAHTQGSTAFTKTEPVQNSFDIF